MKSKLKSKMKFDFNMKINNKIIVKLLFLAIIAVGFYFFTRPIIEGGPGYQSKTRYTNINIPVYDVNSRQKVYNILQTNDTNLNKLLKLKNLLSTDFKPKKPFPPNPPRSNDSCGRDRCITEKSHIDGDSDLIKFINFNSTETLLLGIIQFFTKIKEEKYINPIKQERDQINYYLNLPPEPATSRLYRIKYQLNYNRDTKYNNNSISTNPNAPLRQVAFADYSPDILINALRVHLQAIIAIPYTDPVKQERDQIDYYLKLPESAESRFNRIKFQLQYNRDNHYNYNNNPYNPNNILSLVAFADSKHTTDDIINSIRALPLTANPKPGEPVYPGEMVNSNQL